MDETLLDLADRVWAAAVRTHDYRMGLRRETAERVNATRALVRETRRMLYGNDSIGAATAPAEGLTQPTASHQEEIVRLKEELATKQRLLDRDDLLPCASRRTLAPLLEHELARASRDRTALAVAMVDIDHFKAINDEHGHDAGDAAVVHFGNLMRASLRTSDVCVRYGGDEFVMILPTTNSDGATEVACKLINQMLASPLHYRGIALWLSISVGVAELLPHETWRALMRRADRGLYAAKAAGRGCVRRSG